MLEVYALSVVVSILIYLWLCITDVKKSLCQNIMILVVTAANIGYLSLGLSENLAGAILSTKIIYISGCYLPMLFFFTVCEICDLKLKKRIMIPLECIQTVIYGMVWTIGYSDIYYKSVSFAIVDGIGTLTREYGPAHLSYLLTMYAYLAAALVVAIVSSKKNKVANFRDLRNMIACISAGVLAYTTQRIAGVRMDIMPLANLVLIVSILPPLYHSNMYTVTENKNIIRTQLGKVGFISFDKKMRFMGASDMALSIFEGFKGYTVGKKITHYGPNIERIMEIALQFSETGTVDPQLLKRIAVNDKYYDIQVYPLQNFAHAVVGFTLEIVDGTEHYHMLELSEDYNDKLSREVKEQTRKIRSIQDKTILGMGELVESRDLSTGGHVKRTSEIVRIFSEKLINDKGYDRNFMELVIRSAPMHDIGKIGVDDAILRKQGKFTPEERLLMMKHSEIGGKMIKTILTGVEEEEFVQVAFNMATYHHEKVNGTGYPKGLKGDEIPIEARIMALADVFDALVSERCYKEAFSYEEAFRIIRDDAGEHFDSDLVDIFVQCEPELKAYYDENGN